MNCKPAKIVAQLFETMKNDNTQHTPTPWKYTKIQEGLYEIESTNPRLCTVAMAEFLPHYDAEAAANARRIVAAVNSCAGIETEYLEAGIAAFPNRVKYLESEVEYLRAKNERLRDALSCVKNLQSQTRVVFDQTDAESLWNTVQEIFNIAHAAIAESEK